MNYICLLRIVLLYCQFYWDSYKYCYYYCCCCRCCCCYQSELTTHKIYHDDVVEMKTIIDVCSESSIRFSCVICTILQNGHIPVTLQLFLWRNHILFSLKHYVVFILPSMYSYCYSFVLMNVWYLWSQHMSFVYKVIFVKSTAVLIYKVISLKSTCVFHLHL